MEDHRHRLLRIYKEMTNCGFVIVSDSKDTDEKHEESQVWRPGNMAKLHGYSFTSTATFWIHKILYKHS
jgi:hypothetical protein